MYVHRFAKFQERHRLSDLVRNTHPSAVYEGHSHHGEQSVHQHQIESRRRITRNKTSCNLHTEQDKHDSRPVAMFSLVVEEFLVCQVVMLLLEGFRYWVQLLIWVFELAGFGVDFHGFLLDAVIVIL